MNFTADIWLNQTVTNGLTTEDQIERELHEIQYWISDGALASDPQVYRIVAQAKGEILEILRRSMLWPKAEKPESRVRWSRSFGQVPGKTS
jgi:hypothetical protein